MNEISHEYNELLEKFFHTEKIGDYTLDKTRDACNHFGNPQDTFKSIHIAGTNGKGSVSKMVFQILKEAGKKVGVYTSPHLIDIRERFETEKGHISEKDFIKYAKELIVYGGGLSYFERCALLAFLYFRDEGCEYGVIEVGMGGRLDSTNIITPVVSTVTSIGYDHMEFLGDTLEKIAYEKGGIIKPGIPVVLYGKNPTLETIAQDRGSQVIIPQNRKIVTNLLGDHQLSNSGIAYEIGLLLGIDENTIQSALLHIHHPGRIDYIYPNLLIDGAHNEEGMKQLKKYLDTIQLQSTKYNEIVYCFNLKQGKSASLVINTFPDIKNWYVVDTAHPMVTKAEELVEEIMRLGRNTEIITAKELIIQRENSPEKLFVVFGSLYMIGEFKISES